MSLISSYGTKKDRKIYGNCQVFSPDDILMFRCDEKRINWYLNKGLAELICYNPLSIRLNFEPNGLGNHNKIFGLTEMVNKCVNCGTSEFLTRHHVVPFCYRKQFPLRLKSHNFHDVLSMCVSCHENYERKADELKISLAKKYKAPVGGEIEKSKEVKYIKISRTLLSDTSAIPKNRLDSLKSEIKSYYGINRLTLSRLKRISEIKTIVRKTHGEIVFSKIDNIQDFVEMWRTHFIENNSCQFLPKNWSVKTKVENE